MDIEAQLRKFSADGVDVLEHEHAIFQRAVALMHPDLGAAMTRWYNDNWEDVLRICGSSENYRLRAVVLRSLPNADALGPVVIHYARVDLFYKIASLCPKTKDIPLESLPRPVDDSAEFFELLLKCTVSSIQITPGRGNNVTLETLAFLALDRVDVLQLLLYSAHIPDALESILPILTNLKRLQLRHCILPRTFFAPRRLLTLELYSCASFGGRFVLDAPLMKSLSIYGLFGGDRCTLTAALPCLEELRVFDSNFTSGLLQLLPLKGLRTLNLGDDLKKDDIDKVICALQERDNRILRLQLRQRHLSRTGGEQALVAALKSPNCVLEVLEFVYSTGITGEFVVDDTQPSMVHELKLRRALFALLEGRQCACALRKLPLELLRLTGLMIL